ncbi:hypothetical protein NECID01_0290 [Nematocida sp. AWRm77]|nr:hypothetical protein NECID01_0290 [Nematocida sp. AWRm77]
MQTLWTSNLFLFYEQLDSCQDDAFLRTVCTRDNLYFYVENEKNTIHYILSGHSFVIDLFYLKEEKEGVLEEQSTPGAQGGRNSFSQTERDKPEETEKVLARITVTLVEEAWSKYFQCFSSTLFMYLAQKKYVLAAMLIEELCKYDGEDSSKGRSFRSVAAEIQQAEKALEDVLEKSAVERLSYSVHDHAVCLWWEGPQKSVKTMERSICCPFTTRQFTKVQLVGGTVDVAEIVQTMESLKDTPILWNVLAEASLVPATLSMHRGPGKTIEKVLFQMHTDKENPDTGYITGTGEVYNSKDELDTEKTILLQRTHSLTPLSANIRY